MSAGAGGHRDQPVGALLDGFPCKEIIDHVVQDNAAVRVHRIVDVAPRAQRGDHDRDLVLHAKLHVVLEPRVRLVHDLVHRVGSRRPVRMGLVPGVQLLRDALQPDFELIRRARIQGWKRADDPGLALRDHQLRTGDDEQGRADHRHAQTIAELLGQGHWRLTHMQVVAYHCSFPIHMQMYA